MERDSCRTRDSTASATPGTSGFHCANADAEKLARRIAARRARIVIRTLPIGTPGSWTRSDGARFELTAGVLRLRRPSESLAPCRYFNFPRRPAQRSLDSQGDLTLRATDLLKISGAEPGWGELDLYFLDRSAISE